MWPKWPLKSTIFAWCKGIGHLFDLKMTPNPLHQSFLVDFKVIFGPFLGHFWPVYVGPGGDMGQDWSGKGPLAEGLSPLGRSRILDDKPPARLRRPRPAAGFLLFEWDQAPGGQPGPGQPGPGSAQNDPQIWGQSIPLTHFGSDLGVILGQIWPSTWPQIWG